MNKLCVLVMTKWLLEEGQNLPYDWRKRNNKS